jgi:ribulose-5-phosphate 4-epimerase/fuculose-1-phosphate aldolase
VKVLVGGRITVVAMAPEQAVREDLAAAFRWAARLGLHEAVANHFSATVPGAESRFLLNPKGRHFSRIRASELLLLDADQAGQTEPDPAADPSAWYLHGHLHRCVPRARVILHTHMRYATALACLAEFELLMLDQNACRFHERIAYDHDYAGVALDDHEGERVAKLLGDEHSVLMLGNHGVIVIGETVARAFDELYYLERAAELQVLALSTGRRLAVIDDETAQLACRQWAEYPDVAEHHFAALREILDEESPEYRE